MRLAFSTLGCPDWELDAVVEAARRHGYEAVELRALGGSLDLLGRPEFRPEAVAATRARLSAAGLSVCCVDSSCSFDSADAGERARQIELAAQHCELAAELAAPLVRVFPDRIPAGATRGETRERIVEGLREAARRAPRGVRVGLETHGDFARGAAAAEILLAACHPNLALIWDVANSINAGDTMEEAARAVAPYLAHVHLRDALPVPGQEHWRPVLAGRGEVPFDAAVDALRRTGYDGFISFEWEKYWQPDIEEPEVAIPDFALAMREVLRRGAATRGGSGEGQIESAAP